MFAALDRSRPHDEDGCEAEEAVPVQVHCRHEPGGTVSVLGLPLTLAVKDGHVLDAVARYLQRQFDSMANSRAAEVLYENRKRAASMVEATLSPVQIKVPRFIAHAALEAAV